MSANARALSQNVVTIQVFVDAAAYSGDAYFLRTEFQGPHAVEALVRHLMGLVTKIEDQMKVAPDDFKYEYVCICYNMYCYAPTHPNWLHMPKFYVISTNTTEESRNGTF